MGAKDSKAIFGMTPLPAYHHAKIFAGWARVSGNNFIFN